MVDRRRVLLTGLGLAALPLLGGCGRGGTSDREAASARLYRIGWLSEHTGAPTSASGVIVFHRRMEELGYRPDDRYRMAYRWSGLERERLADLAADLVRRPVDVLVADGVPATLAAKAATSTVPVVFLIDDGVDPVQAGIIAGLARPGANVTGVTWISADIYGKALALLAETTPGLERVAVLLDPTRAADLLPPLHAAAHDLGLTLQRVDIRDASDQPQAFRAIVAGQAQALFVFGGTPYLNVRGLTEFAAARRLPTMSLSRQWVERFGGLLAYGRNLDEMYRLLAETVTRLLTDADPATFPVQRPSTFEFYVSLPVARRIGLSIPPSVLAQATEVIQ